MIRCARCGHSNREDNLFCTHCGVRLSKDSPVLAHLVAMNANAGLQDYSLSTSSLRIGRRESNDIVIDEEHVSEQHANILYEEGQFWIEDLRSTNGTYVNGKCIEDKVALKNEDLIKIGTMIFKFKLPYMPPS